MNSVSSAVAIAFSRSSSVTVLLKAMFSRSVRLKMIASWKTKPTCWCSVCLVVVVDLPAVVLDLPDVGVSRPVSR